MKTVLIIDDNAEFCALMGQVLQEHDWRVLTAGDGEAGLALARQYRPQLVLCDLLMPRSNGFQVCRNIRADVTLRHAKIIVTSGRDYESDRTAAREAGADAYLTKPIPPEAILKAITGIAATKGGAPVDPDVPGGNSSPLQIKFWGVRGSIPTPGPGTVHYGGNTACVEIRAGKEIIILDAGTGLRALGRSLVQEFKDQPLQLTLLLTHTHWDHIQGLPFFAPLYQAGCRLRIFGYEGARRGLVNVLSGQMESPYFPVPFGELPGNVEIEELKDMRFQVGPVRVESWFANHPGICVGYRLFAADGSVAFFPDNEPQARHRLEAAKCPEDSITALQFAREEEQKLTEFLRGTDVLILDSQFDCQEYQKHVGWGHGCVDDAVALALRARAKRLVLFHHDPDHDDAKVTAMTESARQMVQKAGGSLIVEAAREGEQIRLPVLTPA